MDRPARITLGTRSKQKIAKSWVPEAPRRATAVTPKSTGASVELLLLSWALFGSSGGTRDVILYLHNIEKNMSARTSIKRVMRINTFKTHGSDRLGMAIAKYRCKRNGEGGKPQDSREDAVGCVWNREKCSASQMCYSLTAL